MNLYDRLLASDFSQYAPDDILSKMRSAQVWRIDQVAEGYFGSGVPSLLSFTNTVPPAVPLFAEYGISGGIMGRFGLADVFPIGTGRVGVLFDSFPADRVRLLESPTRKFPKSARLFSARLFGLATGLRHPIMLEWVFCPALDGTLSGTANQGYSYLLMNQDSLLRCLADGRSMPEINERNLDRLAVAFLGPAWHTFAWNRSNLLEFRAHNPRLQIESIYNHHLNSGVRLHEYVTVRYLNQKGWRL